MKAKTQLGAQLLKMKFRRINHRMYVLSQSDYINIQAPVVQRPGLFTIYKQKPVGTRFVQIVSKYSRMGNSVGIGVYHLQNSFKFTEGVWRKAKSWENANGKHVFRLEIPCGNFGLPFKKSCFLRKFSEAEAVPPSQLLAIHLLKFSSKNVG